MPKVKIDALREGMVSAADVKNLDDMLLLPAGVELTERHINILRTWGVVEVAVEAAGVQEEPQDPLEQLSPEVAARLQAEVRRLFWEFDEANPVLNEVARLVLRRKARQALPA
jgi:hypothetical protein